MAIVNGQRQEFGPDGKPHYFPVDATNEEVAGAMEQYYPRDPAAADVTGGPKSGTGNTAASTSLLGRQARDFSLDMIPQAGGAIGGIAGGMAGNLPGALGGAAVGQAGGRAVELGIKRGLGLPVPADPKALALDLGLSAGEGIVNEAGGRVLAGTGKFIAKAGDKLLARAVNAPKPLLREFPDVMGDIASRKLEIGNVRGEGGSQVAADMRRASGRKTRAILKAADRSGVTLDPVALMPDVDKMVSGLPGDVDREAAKASIHEMIGRFLDNYSGPLSPSDVKLIKQIHQRASQKLFKSEANGNILPPDLALQAQFRKGIADASQQWLESIPKFGDKIARQEANTKGLIGATKALGNAELSPNREVKLPYIPGFVQKWIPAEARTPSSASRFAHKMRGNWAATPQGQFGLGQVPRSMDALSRALYDFNHEPDSTVTR